MAIENAWQGSGMLTLGLDLDVAVLFEEAVYPSLSVHDLLLPRKERVAVGADFRSDDACLGRAGRVLGTASADDLRLQITGMDIVFGHRFLQPDWLPLF